MTTFEIYLDIKTGETTGVRRLIATVRSSINPAGFWLITEKQTELIAGREFKLTILDMKESTNDNNVHA